MCNEQKMTGFWGFWKAGSYGGSQTDNHCSHCGLKYCKIGSRFKKIPGILWFNHEFIPEGKTVDKETYIYVLGRHMDAVRRKRPEEWKTNSWFFLHDNAPAHRSVGSGISYQRTTWQLWIIPHSLLIWLQPIIACSLDWNQHWREGAFMMLLT